MTYDERIALFRNDLEALVREVDATVIFNLAADENTFAQFSHAHLSDPLVCEVGNRREGWSSDSLDAQQAETLRTLGFEIPLPHEQVNPHREYPIPSSGLAEQVEQVFRLVFRAPEDYAVESSGVIW